MNNPKVFIFALLGTCLLLVALVFIKSQSSSNTFKATVEAQTLTQSLDGNRNYLNVITDDQRKLLISSPPTLTCPQGSRVKISAVSSLFNSTPIYSVVACYQQEQSETK